MKLAAAALVVAVVGACDRRAADVTACDDNLHGVWATPSGARWMMLDNGGTLEAYPLFDDGVPSGAPRVIDLRRGDGKLAGDIKRRYMQRAHACDARAPIHVTACKDNTLQLVLGEVAAPLTFAPCSWSQQVPSRVETWRRD